MTPEEVRLAMVPLVRRLVRFGARVRGFDGLRDDVGQLMVAAPDGTVLAVEMPISLPVLIPLDAFVADAQARIGAVLRPWETANRNGFDRTGACVRGLGDQELIYG